MSARQVWTARAAGVAFGVDLLFWSLCIEQVGAGLATVLGNLQVAFLPFLSFVLWGERLGARLLVSTVVMGAGVVLISGVLGTTSYARNPVLGVMFGAATSLFYAAFILCLRSAQPEVGASPPGVEPLLHATWAAATLCTAVTVTTRIELPSLQGLAWLALLALTSQVSGWMLLGRTMPILGTTLTGLVLLIQPAFAVVTAYLVLNERVSLIQIIGIGVVLAGLFVATTGAPSAVTKGRGSS